MILRRLGRKTKIANKLIQFFPKHDMFIDMFFGAGGLFFNKPLAKINILNDNDKEVFNLFTVFKEHNTELLSAISKTPIDMELFNYWKTHKETETIWQAVRFLWLSNMGYLGKPDTLRYSFTKSKQIIYNYYEQTLKKIEHVMIMNKDFREVLNTISFTQGQRDINRAFIYADPPYLGTENNYQDGFTEQETNDLFDILCNSGIRFAMSEFSSPVIIEMAEQRKLNINIIGTRQTIKSRNIEILITNYEHQLSLI